jgi:hypothetical protein
LRISSILFPEVDMTALIDVSISEGPTNPRPRKVPAIPVYSKVAATILEVGEIHGAGKRAPYRTVTVKVHGADEAQPMILPTYMTGDAADDRLLRAIPALHAAGISDLTLAIATAETWKHPRILGASVFAPGHCEAVADITAAPEVSHPTQAEQPQVEAPAAAPTPAPARAAPEDGIKLQAKRYNTSDGFDRQMIKLPGAGPLSKLFEGSGFYKWHKFGEMFLVHPVASPATDEAKRLVFKSSAPQKNGDREVFFHCMVRASKHAKANAPLSYFIATPHQGGMQLHRVK